MKRFLKKTLALFICVLMLFGTGLFTLSASAKMFNEYAQGDLVTFGWYPQSKVTDSTIVDMLNGQSAMWHSYGYYSGTGSYSNGNMVPSGYMEYADVMFDGHKYRGVKLSQYRPLNTGLISSANNSFQDENGYVQSGNTYWFLWEPLQWRVLDVSTGLVLCKTIIDSQPYNNYILYSGKDVYGNDEFWGDAGKTHFANNYAESSLRQWLNDDFCNTAFSPLQQDIIVSTTLDNSAYSTSYSAYDSAFTTDKIFLLSYGDMTNTAYGFNAENLEFDLARKAQGSDYAKCQGLYVDTTDGYSRWRLRSAGYSSDNASIVEFDGWVSSGSGGVNNTTNGVRPALKLNLTSEIFQSDVSETGSDEVKSLTVNTNPTKMSYYAGDTLNTSGLTLTATYNSGKTETLSSGFTCSPTALNTVGTQTITAEYQGKTTTFSVTVSEAPHKHAYKKIVTAATGTKCGYTTHTCESCGNSFVDSYTAPTGKISGFKCKTRSANAETLIWNKVSTATGYQVQISTKDGKKWDKTVTIKSNKTVTTTIKSLAAGNAYKFRARFYIKAKDGKNYYSPWSQALNSPTLPSGTTLTKLTPAKKAFTAQWKQNKAVAGYQIQYSTGSKFSKAKTVTVKNYKTLKTTVKKLNAGKYYYVRIRTYKTISNVKYYSAWSKTYKVKTK